MELLWRHGMADMVVAKVPVELELMTVALEPLACFRLELPVGLMPPLEMVEAAAVVGQCSVLSRGLVLAGLAPQVLVLLGHGAVVVAGAAQGGITVRLPVLLAVHLTTLLVVPVARPTVTAVVAEAAVLLFTQAVLGDRVTLQPDLQAATGLAAVAAVALTTHQHRVVPVVLVGLVS
jgi:hypothetical protein